MIFSGYEIGVEILPGVSLQYCPLNSPIRRAYLLYGSLLKGRASWDLTAVLIAVRGVEDNWTLHNTGSNQADSQGHNQGQALPDKDHAYLVQQKVLAAVACKMETLIQHQPGQTASSPGGRYTSEMHIADLIGSLPELHYSVSEWLLGKVGDSGRFLQGY